MKKCVFAGTFDPPTLGHKKTVEKALAIFDEVVVALMINPEKTPCFSLEERLKMLDLTFADVKRVTVCSHFGTVADLLQKEGTNYYVRGVRSTADFAYETENMYALKKLCPESEVVYLPCEQEDLHISSSVCRTLLRFDKPLDGYVTEGVKEYIGRLKK